MNNLLSKQERDYIRKICGDIHIVLPLTIDGVDVFKELIPKLIDQIDGFERIVALAKMVNNHWNDFGQHHGFDECMNNLDKAIDAGQSTGTQEQINADNETLEFRLAGADARIMQLKNALVQIIKIFAGMDTFLPETKHEIYQDKIITQMYQVAVGVSMLLSEAGQFEPVERYWLCCGSIDPLHSDKECHEAERGHPENCKFGTREEHSRESKAYDGPVARVGNENPFRVNWIKCPLPEGTLLYTHPPTHELTFEQIEDCLPEELTCGKEGQLIVTAIKKIISDEIG